MAFVKVYENALDGALKEFSNQIKREGLMIELSSRKFYMKPSIVKREKQKNAAKRRRREERDRIRNKRRETKRISKHSRYEHDN